MRLILIPSGGLANRMRAIDSAFNMQNEGRCSLKVLWYQDWGMGCAFSDIFEPAGCIRDCGMQGKLMKKFMRLLQKNNRFIRGVLKVLYVLKVFRYYPKEDMDGQREFASSSGKRYLTVLMESWEYFYEKERFNNECFTLKENGVYTSLKNLISSKTVGVHIRRSDNKWSVENSPLERFEEEMKNKLAVDPETGFLVCTDDEGVRRYFSENAFWKGKVVIPYGELSRDSVEGIRQAAGEMYALSCTRMILGSYWSSFGEMAAKIGGVELRIVAQSV